MLIRGAEIILLFGIRILLFPNSDIVVLLLSTEMVPLQLRHHHALLSTQILDKNPNASINAYACPELSP